MIARSMLVVAALAAFSLVVGCSSDDGKPTGQGAEETSPAPSASNTQTTGKKGPIEACTTDDDCTSSVCYLGDQGSYCSLKCTADTASTVCAAPFAGTCNKKGFCKKP